VDPAQTLVPFLQPPSFKRNALIIPEKTLHACPATLVETARTQKEDNPTLRSLNHKWPGHRLADSEPENLVRHVEH